MTRPFSRAMTPLRISLMAASTWIWGICYNLLPFFNMTSNGLFLSLNFIIYSLFAFSLFLFKVYKEGATQCGPIIPCSVPEKIHSLINTTMNYVLPVIVMSFCNFKIARAVTEHMGRYVGIFFLI